MKKLRDILGEETKEQKLARIRGTAEAFGKEVDFQKQKLETKPTPLPKPTGVEKIDSNDILSGSRYSDGIVSDQDKSTRQIQKQLRKDYQQPPGFGTPSYNKARDKIDIEFKKNLPGLPDSNVPAEAVPGSIRPQYTDPMKTSPAVPVPVPKPKAKPAEIDQRVPRPKMKPEIQGPIRRVEIKWPEKKTKQITDRVPSTKLITDRLPKDEMKKFDNTKTAVPIPKPTSTSLDFTKPKLTKTVTVGSDKNTNTLWDIAKNRVGKGGDVNKEIERIRKLNKNIDPKKLQKGQSLNLEAATFPNTKYVPGLTQPGKQLEKRITDRVPETPAPIVSTGEKQFTDRVPREIDPNIFKHVKHQESRGKPRAESPVGASGLMQIMPKTGAEIAKDLKITDYPAGNKARKEWLKSNPKQNEKMGQYYLNKQYKAVDDKLPDEESKTKAVLAMYNAGPGRASKYIDSLSKGVDNRKLIPKETRGYIKNIYTPYKKEVGEFSKVSTDDKTKTTTVTKGGLNYTSAAAAGTEIKNKPATPETNTDQSKSHKVGKGESAAKIAQKYNMTLPELEKFNPGITKKSNTGKLYPGDTIKIK